MGRNPVTQKLVDDKEWLTHQHQILEKPIKDIAKEFHIQLARLSKAFKIHGIEIKIFKNTHEKRKKTLLERYGVENVSDIPEANVKRKQTCVDKYGVENPSCSKVVQQKRRKTCLDRYGEELYCNTDEFKYKTLETLNINYGVENPSLSKEICDRRRETFITNYGVDHPMKVKSIVDKAQASLIVNYGHDRMKSVEFQDKSKATSLKKYGRDHWNKQHISLENLSKLDNHDWLFDQHHTLQKPLSQIAVELDVGQQTVSLACNRKGIEHKNYFSSIPEKEIAEYLSSIYKGEIVCNTRTVIQPKEVDIYLPERKLAIEFNGLFWHSFDRIETPDERSYHLSKLLACESQGIQLLQIFENEWQETPAIVKSIIAAKLGIYEKLGARSCTIKDVSNQDTSIFLNANHLQGYCQSKVKLGLYYNDELVSIMTFGQPRYNKSYEWELVRFANRLNLHVQGAAGKLLNYFKLKYNPKTLLSYADRRYSNGKLYESLGFELIGESKPNYFYVDNYGQLFSRIKFQKHKLANQLLNFDPRLTEAQNMFNNGYRRIWDCGNLKYLLTGSHLI